MAQSESQKKQRDRRKKRKREKEDQNQQEEEKDGNGGEDEVLRRDPFEVFGRDIMLKILRNLDARSVALSLLVSRGWHSVASSDRLWSSKCEELWLGKAHIPRLSQIRGLSKLAAYSLSVMDGKRTRIMKDDLCDHVWEFHFNELHGAWASPFGCRVVWALKLKGIPYENIEEDLPNKSKLILQYNPVHKKIPVLVHGRKPICESMIIIEYIDETWPQNPLLPSDPYQRALARFWVKFAEDKGFAVWTLFRSSGEEQEKAKNESLESLRTIEKHGLGNKKFFGGEEIGIVDIAFGWMSLWLGIIEEIVGVKLLEAHLFPRLYAWTKNFKEVPVIKQNLPDCHELLLLFKGVREQALGSSSSSS